LFLGTVAYRAPEVFNRKYNESVDIYSFGMCLLEMFTKETPYEECRDIEEIRDKIKKKELPQGLTKVDDDVLKIIIYNCLEFDPSKRLFQ
jgi:WNK lysine deficient protein kinase